MFKLLKKLAWVLVEDDFKSMYDKATKPMRDDIVSLWMELHASEGAATQEFDAIRERIAGLDNQYNAVVLEEIGTIKEQIDGLAGNYRELDNRLDTLKYDIHDVEQAAEDYQETVDGIHEFLDRTFTGFDV